MKQQLVMLVLATAAALAGCGGSEGYDDDVTVGPQEVPASAWASSRAFSEYVGSLPTAERQEGLLMGLGDAPASETEEPIVVS